MYFDQKICCRSTSKTVPDIVAKEKKAILSTKEPDVQFDQQIKEEATDLQSNQPLLLEQFRIHSPTPVLYSNTVAVSPIIRLKTGVPILLLTITQDGIVLL